MTPPDPKGTDVAYPNEVGRVRVILDCDWNDLRHALDTVIDSKPMFDRSGRGIGWGWSLSKRDKTSLFVRRTKRGFSATAPLPPPTEALT
jgi:hypothetical protein